MGNCCVTPPVAEEGENNLDLKNNKNNKKKPNPFAIDYGVAPQNGKTVNKLCVLKDPTGREIEARYALGRELGRGEFGITYLCTDRETAETFACKSISKKKLRTAVDIEDVRREVEIMKHLPEHPNIVTLKDTYEDDDAVHIVMELCEGGELFDRIVARGHYTERAAAAVTKTIVEVVQVLIPFCSKKKNFICFFVCVCGSWLLIFDMLMNQMIEWFLWLSCKLDNSGDLTWMFDPFFFCADSTEYWFPLYGVLLIVRFDFSLVLWISMAVLLLAQLSPGFVCNLPMAIFFF